MPTRKDKTNVAPIYREQVFIPASEATLIKQQARPKIAGRPVSSGAIEIVSPEFDLLTGIRGITNLPKGFLKTNKLPQGENLYYRQLDKSSKGLERAKQVGVIDTKSSGGANFTTSRGTTLRIGKTFDTPFFAKGSLWYNNVDDMDVIIGKDNPLLDWKMITQHGRVTENAIKAANRRTPFYNGVTNQAPTELFELYRRYPGLGYRNVTYGFPTIPITGLNTVAEQMKCGGRRKAQLGLDIREGGIAIPIAPNMYYMNGRSHDEGGIGIGPNNKNGLEVEGGEVVKVGDKDIKVFSSVPLLRGVSPAQLVMGGANPNKVFKAQEAFKDKNRIKDDGTRYQTGGNKVIKYENLPNIFKGKRVNGRILQGGIPPVLSRGELAMGSPIQRMSMWTDDLGEFSKYMARRIHKFVPKKVDKAYRYVVEYFDDKGPNNAINNNAENLTKAVSLFNAHEYKYGGNMIYEINGNVKSGLMSTRPKARMGKQRKVEGYGNTIVVGDDTFMLNEDGVYVPVGNVQINKQPKTVRGASSRRDIAYDRQGNRYQRRSDGSLIRVSPEKGNIAVSDTIRGVEVNAPDVTKTRSIKQIKAATKTNNAKANPPRQKVEPNFEIGDQTIVNFLRNGNGKYNTQRTPIHSFTPAQKLGLSSYGWSTYNDPNKGYSFREDAAPVRAGQKSVDEIISQDLSQINFDDNQSSSTPRRGETKSASSKTTTKPQSTIQNYKSNTPKIDLSKAKMPTFDVSQLGSKETKAAKAKLNTSSTGGEKQSNSDGRWIGQYKPVTTADWIGLGSNLAGTVASYFMTKNAINKMPDPVKPIIAQAAKLKTRYNIEPQLTNIREAEQMNRAAVRRNTQSSNTSLAREQRLMNEARGARNVLHGQKENIETQLINQDRLNRQTVMMENVNRYNDYLNRLTGTRQAKNQLGISNINNLLSGLTGSVNNILGTIESRRATNNTLRAIAAANPNVDARLIGGFDYYIDPITKRKYNKNQQYVGTING